MGKIELYEVESPEQSTVDVAELDWLRATNYNWFINMNLKGGGGVTTRKDCKLIKSRTGLSPWIEITPFPKLK
jgi:hypothetical protein